MWYGSSVVAPGQGPAVLAIPAEEPLAEPAASRRRPAAAASSSRRGTPDSLAAARAAMQLPVHGFGSLHMLTAASAGCRDDSIELSPTGLERLDCKGASRSPVQGLAGVFLAAAPPPPPRQLRRRSTRHCRSPVAAAGNAWREPLDRASGTRTGWRRCGFAQGCAPAVGPAPAVVEAARCAVDAADSRLRALLRLVAGYDWSLRVGGVPRSTGRRLHASAAARGNRSSPVYLHRP